MKAPPVASSVRLVFCCWRVPHLSLPQARHRQATQGPPWPALGRGQMALCHHQWGSGRAYSCRAADCGADLTLYLRAKFGFCNCRGVENDEELERVSDLELISDRYPVSGPGKPISVAPMQGRSRPGNALAIAFHDRCDLVVATGAFRSGRTSEVELVVLRFLNTEPVLRWLQATLGL